MESSDEVRDMQRFRSELSLAAGFETRAGEFASSEGKKISYQFRAARQQMKFKDLEHRATPFLREYFADRFPKTSDPYSQFFLELDRTVEEELGNGQNNFGDVLLSLELALPAGALASWLRPLNAAEALERKKAISLRVQAALKRLIPMHYFDDSKRLGQGADAAALIVWAAIPPKTKARLAGSTITFNEGTDVYWNWPDPDLRAAMTRLPATTASLATALADYRDRLESEGDHSRAKMFDPRELEDFRTAALSGGSPQLNSLLSMESGTVDAAAKAVDQAQAALAAGGDSPSKAIAALAEFGATLTKAFHAKVKSVYGGQATRSIGTVALLEATAALDPTFSKRKPEAACRLVVLHDDRQFELPDFLLGRMPLEDDVALTQTLISG